jgi:hypothetical protein
MGIEKSATGNSWGGKVILRRRANSICVHPLGSRNAFILLAIIHTASTQ